MEHSRRLLIFILAIAVVNISSASVLVRLAHVHGFVAAWWRLSISSLLTLIIAIVSRNILSIKNFTLKEIVVSIVSGILLALHFGLWMLSLQYINIAPSVTIVDSYPAILAVIGRVFFNEEYTLSQLLGSGIAMGGVAGLAYYSNTKGLAPIGGDPLLGALLAFGGMLAVAGYFIGGRYVRKRRSTINYTLIAYSSGTVMETVMVYYVGLSFTNYPSSSLIYLLLLALLPMMGGHTLINYVLGRMSLLASTVPVLGEPIGASILGWIFLGEKVTIIEALFMALTLIGITLVLFKE